MGGRITLLLIVLVFAVAVVVHARTGVIVTGKKRIIVTDAFTYSDGALETVSSAVWVRWNTHADAGYLNVLSNKVKFESGTYAGWYVQKDTFSSSNVYAQITLDTEHALGTDFALYINCQGQGSNTHDGYKMSIFDNAGTKTVGIRRVLNGANTTLGTDNTAVGFTAGDVFRLTNESGTIKGYKNGTLISGIGAADATYTAARVGFVIDTDTTQRLDTFEGGDI